MEGTHYNWKEKTKRPRKNWDRDQHQRRKPATLLSHNHLLDIIRFLHILRWCDHSDLICGLIWLLTELFEFSFSTLIDHVYGVASVAWWGGAIQRSGHGMIFIYSFSITLLYFPFIFSEDHSIRETPSILLLMRSGDQPPRLPSQHLPEAGWNEFTGIPLQLNSRTLFVLFVGSPLALTRGKTISCTNRLSLSISIPDPFTIIRRFAADRLLVALDTFFSVMSPKNLIIPPPSSLSWTSVV